MIAVIEGFDRHFKNFREGWAKGTWEGGLRETLVPRERVGCQPDVVTVRG